MSNTESQPKKGVLTWVNEVSNKGAFERKPSTFRNWISKEGKFKPEKNRYHLYISLACPWAHRTLIVRALKGLSDVISYSVVHYLLNEQGWRFADPNEKVPGCSPDPVNGFKFLSQVYEKGDPNYKGKWTVPVLFDKKLNTIVNNESSEIIRMLNSEFNEFSSNPKLDLYPEHLRKKIDEVNEWVYDNINNGVYKCGFATKQQAYEEAFDNLFSALDKMESILSKQRYLAGDTFTEADVRAFTTLVRFDLVYYVHFKCNKKLIQQYPNIWAYTREIYQMPGVKETCDFFHIKNHYYQSHTTINPYRIVPKGPEIDFDEPHNRANK